MAYGTDERRIREIRNVISANDKQCFFSIQEIASLIGKKSYDTAKTFVDGLPAMQINGRKCYFVNDLARRFYERQVS